MGDQPMGELVKFKSFLKKRFKGDKSSLCVYLLQISRGSKYRYSATFFGTRTFDQLVDFCVRIMTGEGEENGPAPGIVGVESV